MAHSKLGFQIQFLRILILTGGLSRKENDMKKLLIIIITCILLLSSISPAFAYYTNMPASLVLGQPNFVSTGIGLSASLMGTPQGVFSDGTRLFVSDFTNSRVLIWNRLPMISGTPADVVLGQPDFTSNTSNNGGISASTMNGPVYSYSDGTHLVVADRGNSRVLVWNSIPTRNQQPADIVIGQPDFTSNTSNNGGISCASLRFPDGLLVTPNGRLLIGDINSRVLIFNKIPTTNFASADTVLGQATCATATSNFGGLSASSFN